MSQISYTSSLEGVRFIVLGLKDKPKHAFVWTSEILHADMATTIDKETDRRNFPNVNIMSLMKSTKDVNNGWWAFVGAYQPAVKLMSDVAVMPISAMKDVDFQTMFNLSDEGFERMFE